MARGLVLALLVLTAAALVTGTVVTGTGPHAGDEDVHRFGFDIGHTARIHSATVLAAAAVAFLLLVRASRDGGLRAAIGGRLANWVAIATVQGTIGYVQYFNGVPEVLVALHLLGATLLWAVTVLLALDGLASVPAAASPDDPAAASPDPTTQPVPLA